MHGLILALLMLAPPAGARIGAPPKSAGPAFEELVKQADAARDANKLDDALILYKRAVKLRPAWDEGWWAIGSIAYDQDKYPDCAQAFNRLVALKPALAPAWIMSGLCEYRLHEYGTAYRNLLRAEGLHFEGSPELAKVGRYHLALLLIKNASFERAIVLLNFLSRSGGTTPEIAAAAGVAGLRRPILLSEVPEADRDLVLKFGNAMAAAFAQDPKEAVSRFQEAIEAYPTVADIRYRYGAYLMNSDAEKGIEEVKKTLELDPAHVPALVTLTIRYTIRGEFNSAKAYGERAVKVDPYNFVPHLVLGRAHLGARELPNAVRELEMATKLASDSADAHFSLAAAYAQSGRKADAARERAEFQRLQKLIDSPVGNK